MNKYLLSAIFLFFFIPYLSAQQNKLCPHEIDKKAEKTLEQAKDTWKKSRDYEKTRELIDKAIDLDPEYIDAYYFLGTIALKKHDDKNLEIAFSKVAELCPDYDAEVFFQLGWLYFDTKKYKDAEKNLKKFLEFGNVKEDKAAKADTMLWRSKIYLHPVPYDPHPIEGLSTVDWEYLPYFSPDNELAFFTRKFELQEKGALFPIHVEKFMVAKRIDGAFEKGDPMPPPFNSRNTGNEGAAAISIDNKHLYFTLNDKGNFDIYSSDFVNYKWTEIKNLGKNVNDPIGWDAQPSISSDGKTLYFASARDSENVNNIDIYYSEKNAAGEWGRAKKLSSKINTSGREKSPFIHPDNKTLYFSSDALPGLGGFDIFVCRRDANGEWGDPVNIGYPINTEADEVGFFVSTDGKTASFASNSLKGMGGYDIYSFDLYPQARPEKVLFVKGEVHDEDEKIPLAAKIELKNALTNKVIDVDLDTLTGKYASVVPFDNDYILTVKKKDYAFVSEYFSAADSVNAKPRTLNIDVKKMEIGVSYPLNNILFATNSYEINDTIKVVLDNFSDFLKDNPKVKVAIYGHTDNVGDEVSNIQLSVSRAKTVYDYLVSREIPKERMTYKGFGLTSPVATNRTEQGRMLNRRTEFVITSK
jgi:outer membrane protein OmpA-like peptidoglycan-associated protein